MASGNTSQKHLRPPGAQTNNPDQEHRPVGNIGDQKTAEIMSVGLQRLISIQWLA
jgi:hypothetical protein